MNLVNTWQEAYSGVGCEVLVLCDTLQIHVLGRECGTGVQDMGYCRWVLQKFSLDGMEQGQQCDQA